MPTTSKPTITKLTVEKRIARLLPKLRWFRGKARQAQGIEVLDRVPLEARDDSLALVLARVNYLDGGAETYALYLRETEGKLVECGHELELAEALRTSFTRHQDLPGLHGVVTAECAQEACQDLMPSADPLAARPASVEQSNTSIVFGDQYILKLYRGVEPGVSPELELTRFLTAQGFPRTPPTLGTLVYRPQQGSATTLGILQGFVRAAVDGWKHALESVERAFQDVRAATAGPTPAVPPPETKSCGADFAPAAQLLGQRTAELHWALGSSSTDPALKPEPFGETGHIELAASLTVTAARTFELLAERAPKLKGKTRDLALKVLAAREAILTRLQSIAAVPLASSRIRCHGDYHLGQVLWAGNDFVITDFEGEVARPLEERRRKSSPLRDVTSMLRSFHYASCAPLQGLPSRSRERRSLEIAAQAWCEQTSEAFLRSYLALVREAPFLPRDLVEQERLLKVYLLEKALYEVAYELSSRPKWLWIPLQGVLLAL